MGAAVGIALPVTARWDVTDQGNNAEFSNDQSLLGTSYRSDLVKRNSIFIFLLMVSGCVDIQLPDVSLIGDGPIVLPGTMSDSADSGCPLWIADNGLRFILFQDARISNADFDAITTPGTSSRLSLSGRTDLGEPCVPGADHAVVTRILAIDGVDF